MICDVCGKNISDSATKCPYCFATIKQNANTNKKSTSTYVPPKSSGSTKFCSNCGKSIPLSATICPYCARSVGGKSTSYSSSSGTSKKGLGVLFCLFLGLIGLIIGICIYPSGSVERDTFVSGWVTTLIVTIVISVVLVLFAYCVGLNLLSSYS